MIYTSYKPTSLSMGHYVVAQPRQLRAVLLLGALSKKLLREIVADGCVNSCVKPCGPRFSTRSACSVSTNAAGYGQMQCGVSESGEILWITPIAVESFVGLFTSVGNVSGCCALI